ncbi:MAG: PGN_0703 family putative restriction endonuclease [Gemmatimonadota bacterium]
MTYQQRLNKHLADYKRTALSIQQPGDFRYGKTVVKHDHILPAKSAWLNVLEPARTLAQQYLERHREIKLHRYFHHLNSSQAFAFNLFFPYFAEPARAAVLLRALGQTASLKSWTTESIPVSREGTNVDIAWETTDGGTTFCEVKLSEGDFGKGKEDARHLQKLREIYSPALVACIEADWLKPRRFFGCYQIFRNVWHLTQTPNSTLIFLLPRANTTLWKQLEQTLSALSTGILSRLAPIAIEDVIETLCGTGTAPGLAGYAEQLRRKYVPPESE